MLFSFIALPTQIILVQPPVNTQQFISHKDLEFNILYQASTDVKVLSVVTMLLMTDIMEFVTRMVVTTITGDRVTKLTLVLAQTLR